MPLLRGLLYLAASFVTVGAQAQGVFDDFSDGDFTQNPEWSGDVDRFVIAPFGEGNALRAAGLAQADEIYLSTASEVTSGYWRFRFAHSVNLSNVNGSRIYLMASSPELTGEVQGYYVQFGTNVLNRVELWRQDGFPEDRFRLGVSESVVPGDTNAVLVEVTRDHMARWTVILDGTPVIYQVQDETYHYSQALGVWVRHNATGRNGFYWTDFVADPEPGDITPPNPVEITTSRDGLRAYAEFDKPIDPQSLEPAAFQIEPGDVIPSLVMMTEFDQLVRLDLPSPLTGGTYALSISGIADTTGNVQWGATIPFEHDADRPYAHLASAAPLSTTIVEATFDRGVIACDTAFFEVAPGGHMPESIECLDFRTFRLQLSTPLDDPAAYTLTASGFTDVTQEPQPSSSTSFFLGDFATPVERDIVINEIMYAPTDLPSNEYVELLNRTEDRFFDLGALRFANASSPPRVISTQTVPLGPGQFAVLVRNPEAFQARWPGVPFLVVSQFPALVNSGDTVHLLTETGDVIDSVSYVPSWGGAGPALERIDPDGPSHHAANWGDSQHVSGGTPGSLNSIYDPDTDPPVPLAASPSNDGLSIGVAFSEPLDPASVVAAAFSVENGPAVISASYTEIDGFVVNLELAEPLVPGDHLLWVVGVTDWVGNVTSDWIGFAFDPDLDPPLVVDVRALSSLQVRITFDEPLDAGSATTTGNYSIGAGVGQPVAVVHDTDVVLLELLSPLGGPQIFELSVTGVADIHGNVIADTTTTFFYGDPVVPTPGTVVINEIMYAPPEIHSNEYVELVNASTDAVDLSMLTLGDQTAVAPVTGDTYLLGPGEMVVLVRNPSAFAESFPGVVHLHVPGFPTLLNSGDAVVIRHDGAASVTVDSVFYRPNWGGLGLSLERRNIDGPSNSPMNWASSLDPRGGTPGSVNSVPPDTEPPRVVAVEVTPSGADAVILFDEPLQAESVEPAHFSVSTVGSPLSVTYLGDEEQAVHLDFTSPLTTGSYTLLVDGVSDQVGNVASGESFAFDFVVDDIPPRVVYAMAVDSVTVIVRFDESVQHGTAIQTAHYHIEPTIGDPAAATHPYDGHHATVRLDLPQSLAKQTLYTLTVSGVADLAGNVTLADSTNFVYGESPAPEAGQVLLSEIMFRPSDGESEYVELYNDSDHAFELRHLTISTEAAPRQLTPHPLLLLPGEYLALARDASAVATRFGEDRAILEMPNLPALRNTGDALVLRVGGTVIDSVYYDPAWHRQELRDHRGVALERIDFGIPTTDGSNWTSSLHEDGGTPGQPNTVWIPPGTSPAEAGIRVHPSPFDAASGTVIRYRLRSDAGLVRIRVFDGAGRLVRTLEQARLGGAAHEGEVIWNGRDDANQSLRMGIYIVLLEAIDYEGGRTEAYRAAAVLARRFD